MPRRVRCPPDAQPGGTGGLGQAQRARRGGGPARRSVRTVVEPVVRLRLKFEKRGSIRFCSHKDILRIFQRCFAASRIPVLYSQGFHPHIRMSFGPPLKTGWEGHEEFLDVFTEELVDSLVSPVQECNKSLPEGLRVLEAGELAENAPKLANDICAARLSARVQKADVPAAGFCEPRSTIEQFKNKIARRFSFDGGRDDTNGKPPEITDVTITNGGEHICIEYTSTMLSGRIVTPDSVVDAAIGDPSTFRFPVRVVREAQYIRRSREYLSPMCEGVIKKYYERSLDKFDLPRDPNRDSRRRRTR